MRNTLAKALHDSAALSWTGTTARGLVAQGDHLVNDPRSLRGLVRALKKRVKAARRRIGSPALVATHLRKPSNFRRPQDMVHGPALVISPLRHLRARLPGGVANELYRLARSWADAGQGHKVQGLALKMVIHG